ncbi:NAD(P)-dependent oxidoreductase [Mesorhizobium sp. VK25A]|uniref:NAD(P)-dependent oxidoreductase n=1 Tax=Mesorhizobium vachelliae TaxID=3072309 RepID=A0ABU5AB00_9HYPH|nr:MULTISPECIES: NAD(P)-dependent oxidoreductase [unclassified Mesorhizobium]MDX8533709.1 NAD(P)-dependent oxidoreductase [Mesorhizobium sp. VK25D]MDX8546304.1 NAD(P)-dependent oxidoreductase [Mesorhizobium sp. VK25A]
MTSANILICDFVGLRFGADGNPDHSEVKAYIEAKGGVFHQTGIAKAGPLDPGKLHFFYLPQLSTRDELLAEAGEGRYDAVIAAATFIPAEARFRLGGVRIGAGTGNMGSASWGAGSGEGGEAPLMNTPGINSRATAQMAMKALLKVRPDLPVDRLNALVASGQFDTGKDLRHYPTEKLEGKRLAVIGYGNIGREFARLGQAFGMLVTIHARPRHRKWIELEGFDYAASMVDAARGADALSVHLGLGAFDAGQQKYANARLIGDEVLSALNPGAVLINYDRGELVDVSALGRALASGRVSHAAIDADLFNDGGTISGPMLPYLKLVEAHGQRLELLPHAAADTDHPSRVAGAKQAVDQIYAAVVEHRVHNLKGSLPPGFVDMGAKVPPGIGGITPRHLAALADDQAIAADLARSSALVAAFWERILAASEQERQALIASGGEAFAEAANRLSTLMRRHQLSGPFTSGSL